MVEGTLSVSVLTACRSSCHSVWTDISCQLTSGARGSFLGSEKQEATAVVLESSNGDNSYFQAMASSQENILRLGISYELHLGKYIYCCFSSAFTVAQCASILAQQELAGKL